MTPPGPIRSYRPGDLHALHMMMDVCFPGKWNAQGVRELLAGVGVQCLMVVAEKPVAFIITRRVLEEAELLEFGVLPTLRRRGLGGQLLQAAELTLRMEGVHEWWLPWNGHRAEP